MFQGHLKDVKSLLKTESCWGFLQNEPSLPFWMIVDSKSKHV
jgi:hypothetical protein